MSGVLLDMEGKMSFRMSSRTDCQQDGDFEAQLLSSMVSDEEGGEIQS